MGQSTAATDARLGERAAPPERILSDHSGRSLSENLHFRTPTGSLHCVCREKENGGALDIPGNGRLIELEYAQVEDRKLRGQLRNVPKLELLVRCTAYLHNPLPGCF